MPDVEQPTLLVVCDTHHCKFIDVGNHTLLVGDTVESKEHESRERPGIGYSPAGMIGGVSEDTKIEGNRLREFANDVALHIAHVAQRQSIEQVYVSAPGKFLSILKDHFSKPVAKMVAKTIDGNFVKEAPRDVLLRFRPDLEKARQKLRDEENYSAKNKPPKKSKK